MWPNQLVLSRIELLMLAELMPSCADPSANVWQVKNCKAAFDILLTTYELMMGKRDLPHLSSLHYEYIVVDEAHRLKNAGCKLNREIKAYDSHSRLLLTGLP